MYSPRHLPVLSLEDVTANFEQLKSLLGDLVGEEPTSAFVRAVEERSKPGPWNALEAVSASLKPLANAETPMVRIEAFGTRAFLRGVYEATAEITAGTVVFKVPALYRPRNEVFPSATIFTSAANVATRWRIKTNGEVELNVTVKSTGNLFLDGLSWNLT